MPQKIILASASPRRRELMGYTGLDFIIQAADVEETGHGTPREIVEQNALLKGRAVAERHPDNVVLSADTVVAVQGQVLGKPKDEEEAVRMLRMLQGVWHEVYTGVTLLWPGHEKTVSDISRVHFSPLTDTVIRRYVRTGEPMDKAGAYALQGIGGMFVDRIEGSYSNVIGLPMAVVRALLMEAGFEI